MTASAGNIPRAPGAVQRAPPMLCGTTASFIIFAMFTVGVIIVLLLCITWGYLRGALRNLLGLAALAIAYAASAPFGRTLGAWTAGHWQLSAGSAYILARVGAGLAIYVSLKISAAVANRRFGQDETGVTRRWNRDLGAVLGLVYGLVLLLIVVFLADSLHKAGMEGSFVGSVSNSWLGSRLSTYNPADKFMLTDVLKLLRDAREDPEVLQQLKQDPQVQTLLVRPGVRAVLDDQELADAIHQGDYGRVLNNPNLKDLLKDKDLMRQILSPDLRSAVKKVVKERRQERGQEQPAGR